MDTNNYKKTQLSYLYSSDSSYIEKLRTTQLQPPQSKKYSTKNYSYILTRTSTR